MQWLWIQGGAAEQPDLCRDEACMPWAGSHFQTEELAFPGNEVSAALRQRPHNIISQHNLHSCTVDIVALNRHNALWFALHWLLLSWEQCWMDQAVELMIINNSFSKEIVSTVLQNVNSVERKRRRRMHWEFTISDTILGELHKGLHEQY